MEIVPGTQMLRNLRTHVYDKWGITLTDVKIIDEFRANEIPDDLRQLLHKLELYRVNGLVGSNLVNVAVSEGG